VNAICISFGICNKYTVKYTLIDELKELWEKGFETYDASSKELFQAHAALLWTISDLLCCQVGVLVESWDALYVVMTHVPCT
jgi:hypothetical protein